VVFDGSYRNVGPLVRGRVHAGFSEGESADDVLLEQALYLKDNSSYKVWLVTSDGGLASRAREAGVKVMYCPVFCDAAETALNSESR
jgi:hypothetical protein